MTVLELRELLAGKSDRYRGLSEDDPDKRGTKLQLAVYGAAARLHDRDPTARAISEYWFVSNKGAFKRVGYPITDTVLNRVCTTLQTIVEGIEGGLFPSRPTDMSSSIRVGCTACDPDALGITELRRAWERKRADCALAPYADLAEPLADEDADVEGEDVADA